MDLRARDRDRRGERALSRWMVSVTFVPSLPRSFPLACWSVMPLVDDAVDRGDQIVLLDAGLIGRAVGNDVLDRDVLRLVVDLNDDAGSAEVAAVEALVESGKLFGRHEDRVAVVDRRIIPSSAT